MLHLITGANGAGKTLNTLKWVRELQVKENRPVCHNGRFDVVEGGELSNWKKIDIKDWQNEPDGTIFLVDECHNDFPLRPPSGTPPEYVRMLAEHRKRGFDFFLVTQHPQNIDAFVRRLIGPPGWHRHLKRTFGVDMVSVLEWAAVNPNCEKDGSGKTASVSMVPFPKEVYTWYRSASLHTGKKRIPKAVWFLLVAAILVPLFGYYAFSLTYKNVTKHATAAGVPAPGATQVAAAAPPASLKPTPEQYLADRTPRIPDFPHTAPAYDEVTKPKQAPYPAACIHMAGTCKCYTQQATLLQVSGTVCLQIVKQGFFMEWADPPREHQERQQRPQLLVQANGPTDPRQQPPQPRQARTVPMPEVQPPDPTQITQADVTGALRARNPAFAKFGGGGL
ncbi:zonular occludens toxin domain-containing protein [Acidovorax sp. A1169]|uniref:zonular occludens toxin domain-containing protein n=1 Tax=Acidovorax sp. A1169 TaxID=3059524 RepID=UPI0027380043|nr:zonular occludens toxin domain-containing protein [Acidovorax sp. A1169]MDP4076912.1 zonular occludens toxin domain-containing protein [Acidovorax sp. A1169]